MVTPGQLNRRAQLFDQLAATIAAGLPLTKALELVGKKRSTGIPKKIIQELLHHLQAGHTFSDAMQLVSGQKRGMDVTLKGSNEAYWLTEFNIALLSVGEETGRLDSCFKVLGRYYASRAKIIRDTIAKLIITVVTLHVALLVFPVTLLVGFVLGIINNQYALCLPFIIEKIIVFGVLYGAVFFLIFACQGNRGEVWRAFVESIFSIIPMLGTAVKYLCLARLAMALEALTNAGVSVVRSWEMAGTACGSPRLKREILAWAPDLETGTTPADMVNQIRYFPEMFCNLYSAGEISGKQDETLNRLHAYYEEEGFRTMQTFAVILNFIIYFTIAIMIAWNIVGFYVGYFNAALNSV